METTCATIQLAKNALLNICLQSFNSFSLDECGNKYTHESIVGGNLSQPGEFPYNALLGYKETENKIYYLCGGSLINKFYVITAAHCHSDDNPIK